jgi:hypothetical protein
LLLRTPRTSCVARETVLHLLHTCAAHPFSGLQKSVGKKSLTCSLCPNSQNVAITILPPTEPKNSSTMPSLLLLLCSKYSFMYSSKESYPRINYHNMEREKSKKKLKKTDK